MKTKKNNIRRTEEQSIAAQKLEIHAPRNSRLLLALLRRAEARQRPDALLHPPEVDPGEGRPAIHPHSSARVADSPDPPPAVPSPAPPSIPEHPHSPCARAPRPSRKILDAPFGGGVESFIPRHCA